jgi:hypothetical protein
MLARVFPPRVMARAFCSDMRFFDEYELAVLARRITSREGL